MQGKSLLSGEAATPRRRIKVVVRPPLRAAKKRMRRSTDTKLVKISRDDRQEQVMVPSSRRVRR